MNRSIFIRFTGYQIIHKFNCCHQSRQYSVRVRFAPSPTGNLHLGGFRTALLNFLFAKKHGGSFILRMEDTDQERAVLGAGDKLEEDLNWLKLPPDESPGKGGCFGPYTQSQRLPLYKSAVDRLIASGNAYPCFCSEKRLDLMRKDAVKRREINKYDGRCRELSIAEAERRIKNQEVHCVRFKLHPPPHKFVDLVQGETTIDEDQGDFVVLKSDGFPTYHLASVVDDHLMQITHILRGIEWRISTGKHIALYEALGYQPPAIAHLPLILNSDGSKLSKRQSDISIEYYRSKQYFPEALFNFVVGNRNNIETLDEIAQRFELDSYSRSSHKLDFAYLETLNQLCLKTADDSSLSVLRDCIPGQSEEFYERVLKWCPERISKLSDFTSTFPYLSKDFLPPKFTIEDSKLLCIVIAQLQAESGEVSVNVFKKISSEHKVPMQDLMHILRRSLCGVTEGPPVSDVVNLLGKEETIRRLKNSSA